MIDFLMIRFIFSVNALSGANNQPVRFVWDLILIFVTLKFIQVGFLLLLLDTIYFYSSSQYRPTRIYFTTRKVLLLENAKTPCYIRPNLTQANHSI